ncbi:hypothetical protein [Mycobacterium sp. 3519A]|uniref:hypothetical protein n=1 Tax=Mycobacterium sp. 3519A TaxID=2057184 RepID=UPI000C7B3811|nr:hypothetical protein [Mycobacterium sp. 3519A]
MTKDGRLRTELLTSGLSDWVSLAETQQIISHFQLAESDEARTELTVRTIRSLLEDGLMQIGELPGPEETFPAWEPIDVAMNRLHERFVSHYDDPASWDYSIWLGLTEAGRKVATELRAKDSRREAGQP